MWQTLLSVFKNKKEASTSAMDAAWADFDTLMVAVEKDEKDLEQLERHVKENFLEIAQKVEGDERVVDQLVN